MISILIVWLFIISSGIGIAKVFKKFYSLNYSSIYIDFFLGLGIASIVLSLASLFVPLEFAGLFFILFIPFGISGIIAATKENRPDAWQICLSLIVFLLILLQVSKTAFVTDTGLYHTQTIRMIEKYPVIKGIGNLHGRLAFNSAFHLLVAAFSFSFLKVYLLSALPGLVIFMGLQFFINSISFKYITKSTVTIALCSLICLLVFYRDWVSSPSPDPIVAILILLSSMIFLNISMPGKDKIIILSIVSLFAVTIKLSSLPIILFPLLEIIFIQINRKIFTNIFIISIVFITPYIIRNFYLSGYIIYPFPAIDIFNVPWKIPLELVNREKEFVHLFARISSYYWDGTDELTFRIWLPIWWKNQSFFNRILCFGMLLSLVLYPFHLWKNRERREIGLFLITVIGVFFWFCQAPYFRFGHGFIILLFAMFVIFFVAILSKYLKNYVITFTFIIFAVYSYSIFREYREDDFNILLPEENMSVPFIIREVGGCLIYQPKDDDFCWDSPFPCTPSIAEGLQVERCDETLYFTIKSHP